MARFGSRRGCALALQLHGILAGLSSPPTGLLMSKPLRVALLGGGKMALEHGKAIKVCQHSRLVAVADTRMSSADLEARFGEGIEYYADPYELLDCVKPDVVHVVTPPGT